MDIASSAANVVGLVFNFAKAAKTCKAVRGRYKDAAFTIDSIRHQSETLQAALHQLANLMLHDASALTSQWDNDKSLSKTFAATINGLEQTNAKLQADLERLHLGREKLGPTDKAKVVWNEDVMREHQSRLQSQVGSLQFLLQVLQVGAVSEVKKDIKSLEAALIQASVSSAGNQCDPAGYVPTRQPLILDDQEDLLDLELPEETAGNSFALRKHQSVHLEILEKEFSTDCDATTSASLIPDSTLAPSLHVDEIGALEELFKDAESVESSPVSQQLQPGDGDSFDKGINSTPAIEPPPAIEAADEPKLEPDTDIPELIREVIRGDPEKVTNYLDAGHDVDSRHPKNDRTGAMFAAFLNHSKVLSLLLKRGANVAAIDCDGRTALHFAASEGSYQCTGLLLTSGASVMTRDFLREIPLHRASRYGNANVVKLLLSHHSDPLVYDCERGRNAMHLAALHNRCEIVEILCNHIKRIEHSGDCSLTRGETIVSPQCSCPTIYPRLNDEDACGDTALHIAIVENHQRIVSTLLRFSKSIADTPMNHHGTMTKVLLEKPQHWHRPLHGAIRDLKLVKALVDGGATVDLPDAEGLTPLMTAIHGKDEEAVGYLLEHGADFHISCSKHKEKTVLQEAVNLCSAAILYRLDTKDPRNDLSTNRGRAILYEAQRRGEWDIVQNLIRHCRARDCIGKVLDGEKTIGFALEFSTVPVVEFLLTNGANPNCQLYYQEDQDLWALPIHVVASAESYSIQAAQCLLQRGASLLSKNGRKKLPCELAMYYSSSPETVGWFLRATIAAIRKQTKTIHIADAMTGFLVESTTRACKQGSVEILQIALKLGKQEIDDFLKMGHLLHIAMRWGRVQVTKYLLEAGCDPTETDLKGRMPTQVPFSAAEGDYNMLSNSQEDYQECLKLVQEAIDLSRTINTTTESTTNQMQLVPTTTHPIPSQHVGLVLTKPPKPSPRQLVSTTTDSPTSRRHRGTVEAPPKPNLRQHSKQTVALTQEFAPRRSRRFLGISMN